LPTKPLKIETGRLYPVSADLMARVHRIERLKESGRILVHYQVVHPLGRGKNAPLLSCPLSTFGPLVQKAEKARDFEVLKEVEYRPVPVTRGKTRWAKWVCWCKPYYQRLSAFLLLIWRDEGNAS
jgi:hypothetical protein